MHTLTEIGKRLRLLLIKLISRKGVVFAIATIFMYQEKINDTTWWLSALIIIGISAWEKANVKKD